MYRTGEEKEPDLVAFWFLPSMEGSNSSFHPDEIPGVLVDHQL